MIKRGLFIFCLFLVVVVGFGSMAGGSAAFASAPSPTSTDTPVPTETAVEPTPAEPPTPDQPLAARVNGQPILLEDYEKEVARFEAAMIAQGYDLSSEEGQEMMAQTRLQILESMIDQVLIEQAATREGVTVSEEEVEAEVQANIDLAGEEEFRAWLEANDLTMEEFRAMVRAHLLSAAMFEKVTASLPTSAEQVHARHILLEKEEEARELLDQLQGGGDFVALAKLYSQDESTREQGGDLGWFSRGLLAPEVEEAAFALEPGQISDVVHSQFGYHVIHLLEKEADRPLSAEMLQSLKEQTFKRWMQEQREMATIERFVETG
jgi:parvulin-like peptidyl-prolyl isomerase